MTLLNLKARRQGVVPEPPKAHWSEPFWRVPFAEKGREMSGADCYGWIRLVYGTHQPQIELPAHDVIDTHDSPAVQAEIARQKGTQLWCPVSRDSLQAFDLVVMRAFWKDEKDGRFHTADGHLGVMVSSTHLMHMEDKVGVIYGGIKEEHIACRLKEFWRHKDVKAI